MYNYCYSQNSKFLKTQISNCKSQEYLTSLILKIVKVLFELIMKTVHVSILLHTIVTNATARIQNFEKRECVTASLRSIKHLQF